MPAPPNGDRSPPTATPVRRREEGLTVDQSAEELGVHPQTIRNWMRNWEAGKTPWLPYTQYGGRKLIHPDDFAHVRGAP